MPQASTNGSGPVAVFDFYPAPEPGEADEVVEERGVQVFLEPDVVPLLDDKLLDAELGRRRGPLHGRAGLIARARGGDRYLARNPSLG